MRSFCEAIFSKYPRFLELVAVGGLAAIMLFPVVTGLSPCYADLLWFRSGPRLEGFSPFALMSNVLSFGDCGAYMESAAGLLRGLAFIAALVWFSLPRQWGRRQKWVNWCGGLFLAALAISSLRCAQGREAWAGFAGYAAMACCFSVSAGLAGRYGAAALRTVSVGLVCVVMLVAGSAWSMFWTNTEPSPVMMGAFYQPNMFSAMILLAVPVLLFWLWSTLKHSGSSWLGYLLAGLVAMLIVSLYFAYNRSAWMCMALAAMLVLALLPRCGWGQTLTRMLVAIVGASGSAVLMLSWGGLPWGWGLGGFVVLLASLVWLWRPLEGAGRLIPLVLVVVILTVGLGGLLGWHGQDVSAHAHQRVASLVDGSDTSGVARVEFYRAALNIWLDHPWWGVGFAGFERYYPSYEKDFRWFSEHSHSLTADLLCENGIVSVVLFYGAVFGWLVWVYRLGLGDEDQTRWWRWGLALSALILLFHAQVDLDFHFITLPLVAAICAGTALGAADNSQAVLDSGSEMVDSSGQLALENEVCGQAGSTVDEPSGEDFAGRESTVCHWVGRLGQYLACLAVVVLLCANCLVAPGEYYYTWGKFADDHGLDQAALQCFCQAADSDPWRGEYQRLATAVMMRGLRAGQDHQQVVAQALARAQAAAALDPHLASVQSSYARLLDISGQTSQAEVHFRLALQYDPVNFPSFYVDLARVLARKGQPAQARALLKEALQRYPEAHFRDLFDFRLSDLQSQLSEVYLALAMLEQFGSNQRLAHLDKAIQLNPRSSGVLYALGIEYYEQARLNSRQKNATRERQCLDNSYSLLKQVYAEMPTENVKAYVQDLQRRIYGYSF